MGRNKNAPRGEDTRMKLLRAALQLFSVSGYHGVSTRDIASLAEVNLAAIAYHFGGKEGLYTAVLDYLFEELEAVMVPMVQDATERARKIDEPDAALTEIVYSFVFRFVQEGLKREYASWGADLLRWELRSNDGEYSRYFRVLYRPMLEMGEGFARAALGYSAGSVEAVVASQSLVGMCMTFVRNRDVLMSHAGWDGLDSKSVEDLAKEAASNACRMFGLDTEGVVV